MTNNANPQFDEFADDYEAALGNGLACSGEEAAYFAEGRIRGLSRRLGDAGLPAAHVLDYGCGTGSSTPLLRTILGAERVIGTDASSALLRHAERDYAAGDVAFVPLTERIDGWADVVYCNGVFHHIPPPGRSTALKWIRDALRPGGLFALCENNPWNPGTRIVMSRIAFDQGAVTLSPPAARRMLRSAGFEILRTDSLFYFPRPLAALRALEPHLTKLPLGAQYMVLARRD